MPNKIPREKLKGVDKKLPSSPLANTPRDTVKPRPDNPLKNDYKAGAQALLKKRSKR